MLRTAVGLLFAIAVAGCGGDSGGHHGSFPSANDAASAPPTGAPEPIITDYLEGLRAEADHAKEKLRQAQRRDDEEEAARRKELFRDADRFYVAERDRLTPRDRPMIGGGIALAAVGGAAMVASFSLWWSASFTGSESLRQAAIGTLCGGAATAGAGVPLIVYGAQRRPAPAEETALGSTTAATNAAPDPGVTLIWAY